MMVGRIGIYVIDYEKKVGEIGYWIAEKLQGRGIITHIYRVLVDFCFKDLGLQRVDIKCRNTNSKSKAVHKDCTLRIMVLCLRLNSGMNNILN